MKNKMLWFAILSILIVLVSWITNMGWLRFILTWCAVPLIHGAIFLATNLFAASCLKQTKKLKIINWWFMATYIIFYVFLPDFDDVSSYFFFRLIRQNDILEEIAFCISSIALVAHCILWLVELITIRRLKKQQKNDGWLENAVATEEQNELP